MNKKILVSLFGSLLLLSGLASCGGETGASSAQVATTAENTSASSDALQIEFWHTSGQTVVNAFQKYINKFQALVKENDGIDIQINLGYQGGYTDIQNKIEKGFATNNYPTLAVAYPDHVADYLAKEANPGDYVVELSSFAEDEEIGFGKEAWIGDKGIDDFVEGFYDEGNHYIHKGMYSLPLMKSSEIMFYNVDLCKRIVADYLDDTSYGSTGKLQNYMNSLTWDEFIKLCSFIRENYAGSNNKAGYDTKIDYPACYDSDSNLFISQMYQNNYDFIDIDENGKGQLLFDNKNAKDMVTSLKKNHDDHLLTTKGVTGKYGSSFFTTQEVIFDIGSSGGAGYQSPAANTFQVGVCKVPYANNNPLYVSQGLSTCILRHKGAENDDLKIKYAFKFLKYLTSGAVSADICVNGSEGYIPVRKSAYETPLYQTYLEGDEDDPENDYMSKAANIVISEIDGHYLNTACFKGTAKIRTEVGAIITQTMLGKETVDDAFARAMNNSRLAM